MGLKLIRYPLVLFPVIFPLFLLLSFNGRHFSDSDSDSDGDEGLAHDRVSAAAAAAGIALKKHTLQKIPRPLPGSKAAAAEAAAQRRPPQSQSHDEHETASEEEYFIGYSKSRRALSKPSKDMKLNEPSFIKDNQSIEESVATKSVQKLLKKTENHLEIPRKAKLVSFTQRIRPFRSSALLLFPLNLS
jgi:hypothetical protein